MAAWLSMAPVGSLCRPPVTLPLSLPPQAYALGRDCTPLGPAFSVTGVVIASSEFKTGGHRMVMTVLGAQVGGAVVDCFVAAVVGGVVVGTVSPTVAIWPG